MTGKRATPIEQFIEDGEVLSSRQRYEKKRKEQGFVRRAYWVHVDAEKEVTDIIKHMEKQYAARIEAAEAAKK